MPNTVRVVLDTNVLVSATLVRAGFPARILRAVLKNHVMLVMSPYLLGEYLDVMKRPHIAKNILL